MEFWTLVAGSIIGWIEKWIHGIPTTEDNNGYTSSDKSQPFQNRNEVSDAIEALVRLGYRKMQAQTLVYNIQDRLTNPTAEELVKVALRQVSEGGL